jgi:hypothetical protein
VMRQRHRSLGFPLTVLAPEVVDRVLGRRGRRPSPA